MIRYLEDFSLDFVSKGYSYRLVIWTTNVVVELFLSKVAITEHINTYNKSFHFVKVLDRVIQIRYTGEKLFSDYFKTVP